MKSLGSVRLLWRMRLSLLVVLMLLLPAVPISADGPVGDNGLLPPDQAATAPQAPPVSADIPPGDNGLLSPGEAVIVPQAPVSADTPPGDNGALAAPAEAAPVSADTPPGDNGALAASEAGAVPEATPLGPVPVGGLWQEFSFTAAGVPATGCAGCTPSAGGNSQFASNPPWTFTASTAVDLTVVDAFLSGDVFRVFDFGVSLGTTSAAAGGHNCGSDPEVCKTDPLMSRGVFRLAPGNHSITIVPTASPSGSGAAYFRVKQVVPVGGPWQEFQFTAAGVPATACTSCTPSSAGNSEYASNPPWIFTASTAVDLAVVDAFLSGDVFRVFDFGVSLGTTSAAVNSGHSCGSDPAVCKDDPQMSVGVFRLAPGNHSITIVPAASLGRGAAYFRVREVVPVGGPWQEFRFTTAGVQATGCTGICVPSSAGNSEYATNPPWTFTASTAVDLTVVDAFNSGDVFRVFDFGLSLGTTSPATGGHNCGSDPAICKGDPLMSRGVFRLAPGNHSITIVPAASPLGGGAAYFRVMPALWQEFAFTAAGVPATGCTGCTPSSGGNSEYASNPPWIFTTFSIEYLTVVDAFASGDVFQVFDFGAFLGTTSAAAGGHSCGSDPEVCKSDPLMSHGVFRLAPGNHSITIIPAATVSPGAAYFRVYTNRLYLPLVRK